MQKRGVKKAGNAEVKGRSEKKSINIIACMLDDCRMSSISKALIFQEVFLILISAAILDGL